ncbi:EAL domain-containing protein [Paucibacter sediminis]|uniref:EAL domain-containing protein n=1 Tax=Paucibacter sediminis TaxID=3019553 RepID=A0AA95NK22_9BURK|nr:EAL domain-containing protein [Paucibacter sp. S2-9]WIT13938.1 EAL domain-containing protein [Paucibacter sp. S2-9]
MRNTGNIDDPAQDRRALFYCAGAAVVMAVVSQLPRVALGEAGSPQMVTLHLLLELFAVIVSVMVVLVAWHSLEHSPFSASHKLLIFGFSAVAGLDLIHALAYEGMPTLLTENSTSKAIFFWLSGRLIELATVALVAARIPLRGYRLTWLALGTLLAAVLGYLGSYHLELFPATFVRGEGVTPFKATVEYLLCLGNLAAAAWLLWTHHCQPERRTLLLGVACWMMGLGEFSLASYQAASDLSNLLGHVYKVMAYGFIYRATFLTSLREPYQRLELSQQELRRSRNELQTLMDNLPLAIARMDLKLRYRYANTTHLRYLNKPAGQVLGRHVDEILTPSVRNLVRPKLQQALQGQSVEFDYRVDAGNNGHDERYRLARLVPEYDPEGQIEGVLAIVMDTTERERTQLQLMDSLREVAELKAALDAHAIVAITDARGVITQVNDKFCSISKYSRQELIGETHRIINSGHHPRTFFEGLWHTIASGQVWNGEICNRAKDGSLYWVYTTIVPFMGTSGKPVQYIAIRADITERKNAEQEAQRMALHDALTGLPNRRLMGDRLKHAIQSVARSRHHGALLLLDLDNFKEVNDTLGHAVGDELLRQVGERLCHTVRKSDTVARLGGDEFVVILDDLGADLEIATSRCGDLGEKVREALAQPHLLNGQKVSAPPSIGIVLFRSLDDQPDELLKQADMALYKAKSDGRNCLRFFDPSLQADITARASLLRDLRLALERDELLLHYQPVVDGAQRILGVEALIRWQHPQRGMVPPAAFIPLAEQTNLVLPIGQWVLEQACQQIHEWADHPLRRGWTVAVNVSARQFHEAEFVGKVLRALRESGADATRLRLELTESMLHDDLDGTVAKMNTLRGLGVQFSLDDFGTGYSSLSYLKKLPLDQIKIDKSFVRDVLLNRNDAAIARTILSLANNLGLGVVAEGVETEAQLGFLMSQGCQAFQGYLFRRPGPVEQLPDLLQPLEQS